MRLHCLALMALPLLAGCGREEESARPLNREEYARDPGEHGYRTAAHIGIGTHEHAFITVCTVRDATSSHDPDPRARLAFENLIRLSRGQHVPTETIFAPGFAITQTIADDIPMRRTLREFAEIIGRAVAVDYRISGGRYVIRYLTRTSRFVTEGGGNSYRPISSDLYTCGDIIAETRFDGPTQQHRLASLALGEAQTWQVIRRVGPVMTVEQSVEMSRRWRDQLPPGY